MMDFLQHPPVRSGLMGTLAVIGIFVILAVLASRAANAPPAHGGA